MLPLGYGFRQPLLSSLRELYISSLSRVRGLPNGIARREAPVEVQTRLRTDLGFYIWLLLST